MLIASVVALINAAAFQGAGLNNIVDVTLNGFNVGMV